MAGSLPHVERAPRSLDVSAAAQFVSQTLTAVTSRSAKNAEILSSSRFLVLSWWGSHWAAGAREGGLCSNLRGTSVASKDRSFPRARSCSWATSFHG